MSKQLDEIKMVKQRHEKKWLAINGVVAVGIGQVGNTAGIIVSVDKNTITEHIKIPPVVNGIPVEIKITGRLSAQ